jgi:hypothetical protein
MRSLIALLAALATAPLVGLATLQAAAPVFADTPGVAPTCFPQSMNPHPTDPVGATPATFFCVSPTPTPSPSGSAAGRGSTGASGSSGSAGPGTRTTAGGSQTTLANSTGSGSTSMTPDESLRFDWRSGGSSVAKSSARNASPSSGGLLGGLVGFFSATAGLVFLFVLLVLMAIILVAAAAVTWLRRNRPASWASRFSRLTFRA